MKLKLQNVKYIYVGLLGVLASNTFFSQYLTKALHQLRGVNFQNRSSVFIGKDVVIDNRYPDLVFIGSDVWITTRCIILAHSFASKQQQKMGLFEEKIATVEIHDGAFIGANSVILPGVSIGTCAYVGAGSVVTTDVEPYTKVAGSPARPI